MQFDESRSIYISESYTKLPFFEIDADRFLNQTTVIYGAPKTGKSTIIKAILHSLKDIIPVVIIISPTDYANCAYNKKVPPGCVHARITKQLLQGIIKRQQECMKRFEIVNRLETLEMLFKKININTDLTRYSQNMSRVATEHINAAKISGMEWPKVRASVEKIRQSRDNQLRKIYKDGIRGSSFPKSRLTKREKIMVQYLDHNPYMMLIMDDCAAQLKTLSKCEELLELFTTVRHLGMSIVIATHNDTNLVPQLRNSAFTSIFTDEESVGTYFGRGGSTSGLSKEKKKQALDTAEVLFREDGTVDNYKKLVFSKHRIRTGKSQWSQFHYAYVNLYDDFKVGSPYLWDLCEKSANTEDDIGAFD